MSNTNIAFHYDTIATEFSLTRKSIWKSVREFIDDDKFNNKKLLDCGCGNGKNMIYANKMGYTTTGIDISNNLLDICKERSLDVYNANILDKLDFGLFDKILCIAVIHHISNIEKQRDAIIGCLNNLKVGGKLLLTVWSHERLDNRKDYRCFIRGDNYMKWNNKDTRYYYIHDYNSFCELITSIPDIEYNIFYERQNWICKITKLFSH